MRSCCNKEQHQKVETTNNNYTMIDAKQQQKQNGTNNIKTVPIFSNNSNPTQEKENENEINSNIRNKDRKSEKNEQLQTTTNAEKKQHSQEETTTKTTTNKKSLIQLTIKGQRVTLQCPTNRKKTSTLRNPRKQLIKIEIKLTRTMKWGKENMKICQSR